ncbi:PD40 domain-containing protein [Candidatus Poribacteria bacterium]|nr:PD40 domain-containing protein [Candidatus Poribacteria bacterium]
MSLQKVSLLFLIFLLFSEAVDAKIVLGSRRNDVHGVYVMDDDGSNQTLLVEEGERWHPFPDRWSPDGKKILFKNRFGQFLMNPDGTNFQKLNTPNGRIGAMSFSPDSKSIVFNMIVNIDIKEIKTVNVFHIETGEVKKIADVVASTCDWAPDGKHIVFAEQGVVGGVGGTLWIMGSDGHNPRKPLKPPILGRFKDPR